MYESAGRDDFALQKYLNCKGLGERTEFNNPDRALAFCGLGSVLYHMEEYKLSARCFLKVGVFVVKREAFFLFTGQRNKRNDSGWRHGGYGNCV